MKIGILIVSFFSALAILFWFFISFFRPKAIRATTFFASAFTENTGPNRLLAVALYVWMVFYYFSAAMLLFTSIMCLFYTFGLIHGEFYLLLDAIGPSAGNIVVHLIYPAQTFLFALFMLVLFLGSAQIFIGPVEPLSRLALKVQGVGDLCKKLVALLSVVLLLELVKTATYALLAEPTQLAAFFAQGKTPLMTPVKMGLLVCGAVVFGAVVGKLTESSEPVDGK